MKADKEQLKKLLNEIDELIKNKSFVHCMGFGDSSRGQHSWTLDEEHSREIIKRGLELGVNFYDTAIFILYEVTERFILCRSVLLI